MARYAIHAMADDQHHHLVNVGEVQKMNVGELFQKIADHEKEYIDQLKADAFKREEERAKKSAQMATPEGLEPPTLSSED